MVLHALKTVCHSTGSSPSYLAQPRSAHVVTTYSRGITAVVPISTGLLPRHGRRAAFQRQVGDFVIEDDSMMNCDEQRKGFCAEASASYAGGDDSDMMSTPVDLPRDQVVAFFSEEDTKRDSEAGEGAIPTLGRSTPPEQEEVMFSEETLRRDTAPGSEGEETKSSPGGGDEGGRFDEELVVPDRPYSSFLPLLDGTPV